MELIIKGLVKDYHKMIFPHVHYAFQLSRFWDLRDNQNHYIHMIGSWIIPKSHVLFEISKDTLNSNLPIFGWTSAATR